MMLFVSANPRKHTWSLIMFLSEIYGYWLNDEYVAADSGLMRMLFLLYDITPLM